MSIAVRLEDRLVQEAAAEARLNRRSTPKQIEFWAEIGQQVAEKLSPQDLLALTQGLVELDLKRVNAQPPSTDELWESVDAARQSGELGQSLQADRVVYQASEEHPGHLEALYPDGSRAVGVFKNGRFYKVNKRTHAA
ncbi:TA system antitoxin ParD family protein [Marinimicrobium sp. C2-29]|uniref:TA system antitoxin ParD family protein n=1 Tax=Marinimicrobium sp. C2-29 TaxID=3139825 RepID=UPI00313976AE